MLQKENGHLTWIPMYSYDNILLSPSYNEKCFRQKVEMKFEGIIGVQYSFPQKWWSLQDNVEKYGTTRQATDENVTRRLRFEY